MIPGRTVVLAAGAEAVRCFEPVACRHRDPCMILYADEGPFRVGGLDTGSAPTPDLGFEQVTYTYDPAVDGPPLNLGGDGVRLCLWNRLVALDRPGVGCARLSLSHHPLMARTADSRRDGDRSSAS